MTPAAALYKQDSSPVPITILTCSFSVIITIVKNLCLFVCVIIMHVYIPTTGVEIILCTHAAQTGGSELYLKQGSARLDSTELKARQFQIT